MAPQALKRAEGAILDVNLGSY
ncbi:uncharacterized protein G2W53_039108 [Senna tora]|uniref:Uncharacterized protein n=1 Tax=Senna tora TaxID=362788 RepID=A0A834W2K3_9FABA|nr:uncharacterized protein G2W53_039108 [Senna tora]